MSKDRCLTLVVWASALLVTGIFLWILGDIVWHGGGDMSVDFLTADPKSAGRAGGIGPILMSTLLIVGVCIAVSLPLGLGAAILLSEFTSVDNAFGRIVRRSLDVLSGVPSIVFGTIAKRKLFYAVILEEPRP